MKAYKDQLDALRVPHEHAVTEDERQIAALKAEIKELKYGVREVIDAVEDLAIAKQQEQITTDQAQRAFDRFGRRITGLKQRFKTEDEEKEGI